MPDIVRKLDALVDAIKALQAETDPRVRILLGSHDADDLRAEALRLSNDIAEYRPSLAPAALRPTAIFDALTSMNAARQSAAE